MDKFQVFREIELWKKPYHIVYAILAKFYLKLLSHVKVIAITGSVGKTLTQNAIASVLSQKYKVVVGDENLDPTFRIPQTIFKARPWHDFIILEYGVEHPGDMDYYLWLVKPDIALVTNISKTHTKYFKNITGVYDEKAKLVRSLKPNDTTFLNSVDQKTLKMVSETKAKVIKFGNLAINNLKITNFSQNLNGSKFKIQFKSKSKSVSSKVIGRHQLLSAHAAGTVGLYLDLSLNKIADGLSKIKPPKHRLNIVKTNKISIIDDTYNSSPKAAKQAIETLVDLGKGYKKIAVLGEMKDLGTFSKNAHQNLGKFIGSKDINLLITIGQVANLIGKSAKIGKFKGKIINFKTIDGVSNEIKKATFKNTLILIKGSRHAHLERIIYKLMEKSLEVNCYHCGKLV